jgi:hypothetical protein
MAGSSSLAQILLDAGEDHGGLGTQVGAGDLPTPELVPPQEQQFLVLQELCPDPGYFRILGLAEGDDLPAEMGPTVLPDGVLQLLVGRVAVGAQDAFEVLREDGLQGGEAPGGGEVEKHGPG